MLWYTQSARADYLLTKQARVVAMTCTHAALLRHRLVELNFKYDSLIMEESGQILEVKQTELFH
jgi:intron-binding protein aquarius